MPGGSQNRQMTLNQDLDRSHMPVTELETSTVPQKQVSQTPSSGVPRRADSSVDSRLNPLESPEGLQPHVSRSSSLFVAGPVLAPEALNFLHGLGRCKNRALSVPQAAGDLGLFCFGQPSPDRAFLLLH